MQFVRQSTDCPLCTSMALFPLDGTGRRPASACACGGCYDSMCVGIDYAGCSKPDVQPLRRGDVVLPRDGVPRLCHSRQLPHLVTIPRWLFRVGVTALRLLPRYQHWTVEMAERLNRDLVFDHADAARDLGFSPRPFRFSPKDLPT